MRRCKATTANGRRCKLSKTRGENFCRIHLKRELHTFIKEPSANIIIPTELWMKVISEFRLEDMKSLSLVCKSLSWMVANYWMNVEKHIIEGTILYSSVDDKNTGHIRCGNYLSGPLVCYGARISAEHLDTTIPLAGDNQTMEVYGLGTTRDVHYPFLSIINSYKTYMEACKKPSSSIIFETKSVDEETIKKELAIYNYDAVANEVIDVLSTSHKLSLCATGSIMNPFTKPHFISHLKSVAEKKDVKICRIGSTFFLESSIVHI